MTGFYSSEDAKIRAYKRNLLIEEKNQLHQAEKLQEYNLAQQGIELQEKGLNKFAEAIGKAVGDNTDSDVKTVGKLNKLNQIATQETTQTKIPKNKGLIPSTQGDVSGNVLKPKEGKIPKNKGLIASPPKMTQTNPINEQYQMGMEDVAASLRSLSDKKEQALRQIYMNTLDDMMDKTDKRSDKEVIYALQNLIERQRLIDAFDDFSKNAMGNAFASKLQRNMRTFMFNHTINKRIESKKQISETQNKAATTIQRRMAELRARKADKRSSMSESTDIGSLGDVSFPRGRPKQNDTNAELNRFTDLLSAYNSSKGSERQKINTELNNIIYRQPNKSIAARMKNMKSGFHLISQEQIDSNANKRKSNKRITI